MPDSEQTSQTAHLPALDGLRGIAVLMVIVCHFLATYPGLANDKRLVALGTLGGMGVDLFFALSGFLITRILLASKGRPHFLKNFYIRRVLRIFPLYYGFLFFIYVLVPLLHIGGATPFRLQIWAWTYTQNIHMTFDSTPSRTIWEYTPHFWSLAVEEHFYLIWPFMVRSFDEGRLRAILIGAIPFSFLCRYIVVASGYDPNYLTPCRLDGLAMGSLLAIAARNPAALPRLRKWAWGLLLLVGSLSAVALLKWTGSHLSAVQFVKFTGADFCFSLVLLLVVTARPGQLLHTLLANKPLMQCGKYSYGMYVLHLTLLAALTPYLVKPYVPAVWVPAMCLFETALIFIVAALIYRFWELPFLNLKDRFKY